VGLLSETELERLVRRLAAIERGSTSPGEREAAELIAAELEDAGARARLEPERAHGTYWWPVGVLTGAAAAAGLSGRRGLATVVGAAAAALVVDDITGGAQWFRRRLLPARETTNVVAAVGPEDAERTIVVVSHHDAAHSGLVFHPGAPRALLSRMPPEAVENANTTPGTMWGAVGGPALVAFGGLTGSRVLRRAGIFISLGYVAAMADIGARAVVPGANDNLTGVAVIASLARSLAAEPVDGLRVLLVSTGSEESFMEGMQAFGRRHFSALPRDRTHFICVDTVGSPRLLALEGEGMVWMNEYPKDLLALVAECADEVGVELVPDLRLRNATDGLIALRAGYPTVTFGSVDEFKIPTNYHWPTDVPENVDYGTVAGCARLCRRLIERLATASPRGGSSGTARSTRPA
jgi:acetylornithine deacetylase/succinyl-diaminopimelate desuccinylase-like protein